MSLIYTRENRGPKIDPWVDCINCQVKQLTKYKNQQMFLIRFRGLWS